MLENCVLQDEALRRSASGPVTVMDDQKPVRVLLADDSAVVRTILTTALTTPAPLLPARAQCKIEICGVARDGIACLEAARNLLPDLLILDIEMPHMDGLTVLNYLKTIAPNLPVIMFSVLTAQGARATLDALARGAYDYVTKPSKSTDLNSSIANLQLQLLPKIAALARNVARKKRTVHGPDETAKLVNGANTTLPLVSLASDSAPVEAVVIGVSTGGPSALEQLLPHLPASFPVPVMIVQHMPAIFTKMLANRLNKSCALDVREAVDGEIVRPGGVWLAKGDWHMKLESNDTHGHGNAVKIHLEQSEPLHYSRPAVDVLFRSAVEVYGAGAMGVVMTGMGSDGAAGALAMHDAGGSVVAQDEASSAVWGMPRRAIETGSVYRCLDVDGIAAEMVRRVMKSEARHAV